jgi:hypothetical protein
MPWDPEVVLKPLREKAPLYHELQFISGDPVSSEAIRSSDTEIALSPIVPTTIRTARRRTRKLLNAASKLEVIESHEKFIESLPKLVDEHIRKTEVLQKQILIIL